MIEPCLLLIRAITYLTHKAIEPNIKEWKRLTHFRKQLFTSRTLIVLSSTRSICASRMMLLAARVAVPKSTRLSKLARSGFARDARNSSASRLERSSKIPLFGLDKWMCAFWIICNSKNGVSSCEMARTLGVTQKSAWFMLHRIRMTMHDDFAVMLSGEVEADETFIGGKARNMHLSVKARRITGTGTKDKTAVMGILERGGKVKTIVVANRKKTAFQSEVKKHVEAGAALYTDALLSYEGLAGQYAHRVVDHAVEYVNGRVHTNGLENFWLTGAATSH